MAKADWENEDFEPKVFQKPLLNADRWEGEDEDDDVKDNWDDEEEEKEKSDQQASEVQPRKKKSLAQIIAEKEEKKKKEQEEKMRQQAEQKNLLTSEEILEEKLRQQKLQEESDLELAKETFGVSETCSSSIDSMFPSTKDDFDNFRRELINKISKYDSSPHFLPFLDDFCRDLCLTLQYDDIKKITSSLNALATEKLKAQKAARGKKKSKKAALNVGKDDFTIATYDVFDEYEDCI